MDEHVFPHMYKYTALGHLKVKELSALESIHTSLASNSVSSNTPLKL